MSDIEKFWEAIRVKFDINRQWHELNQMEQMQVVQGINLILMVLK